ncbi:hypothetical protein DOTSEDRAFT_20053 [Dothistroma septosporum NZE10]|uniref:Uncharacterized protein n=1 Tax=Dothistroma septosporum (strain NZE10 / CBS 128990) TaxID=675120 RepID=N1Q1N2_DOTSN|nr:hypothetical protein DOTSEDRAFT_20053 [Dothistroma septosporum NZE10]
MKSAVLLLPAAAHAFVTQNTGTGCCFHVTAEGGPGGQVDQLFDGQNRIGQTGLPEGQYCINANGGLTDSNGRGCILTPPTGQWQCDAGATPTPGFSVGSDGKLAVNGSTSFYGAPTGDNGGWNIYDKPLMDEPKTTPVTLFVDNCQATKQPPPAPAPPSSACPAELPSKISDFEFPHLIVPVDSKHPDQSFGTSYNGTAEGSISSIFNFDIPASTKGNTCGLKFFFPEQKDLETSAFEYSGDGQFQFAVLSSPATESTTYASAPKVQQDFGYFTLAPGTAQDIANVDCPAGERIGIWLKPVGNSKLNFFQDYNPCPIGLYIVPT